jgi:MFS family permease
MGLAIMGFGAGMVIIPVLPEMIEAIEEKYPEMDENELHNVISGLFIAFQGVGETAGPMLGSLFVSLYGFRRSFDIVGIFVLVTMMLYFLSCGGFTMLKPLKIGEEECKDI